MISLLIICTFLADFLQHVDWAHGLITVALPVMMSLSLCVSSRCPLNKSARPTITRPRMVVRMPSHWLGARRRPRNATESRPVKMMTAPRSIWKLEALVMLRARNKQKRVFHLEIHTFISTTHKQTNKSNSPVKLKGSGCKTTLSLIELLFLTKRFFKQKIIYSLWLAPLGLK